MCRATAPAAPGPHFVDQHPGDAHVLVDQFARTSPPTIWSASPTFEHSQATRPIATLVTEYIAFAVRADSSLKIGRRSAGAPRRFAAQVTVALSTALGNPNHVALAKLTRAAGGDVSAPTIRVFDTALDAVADVVAGKADVCAVTAASVLEELAAGRVRVLAMSAPARLAGALADVPTWRELGIDCVIGAWRGVSGPAGLTGAQVRFWEAAINAATVQPVWREELARLAWSPMLLTGRRFEHLSHARARRLRRDAGRTRAAQALAASAAWRGLWYV